jgi:glyoxylase-like metal-dependent hydrolase (beta-lactamase superfamily II)
MTCGRTDLDGGNPEDMLKSLKRLKDLEGDYDVYPGHYRPTTLDTERVKNRYMKRDLDKWYW